VHGSPLTPRDATLPYTVRLGRHTIHYSPRDRDGMGVCRIPRRVVGWERSLERKVGSVDREGSLECVGTLKN
jgi:hypothetical protein